VKETKNNEISIETIVTVLISLLIMFILIGFATGQPTLFMASFFALAITSISAKKDHVVLNSLSIPFLPLMFVVIVSDLLSSTYITIVLHAPTFIFCILISRRKQFNIKIVILSSIFYDLWIMMAKISLSISYYACVFGICNISIQLMILLFVHFAQAVVIKIVKTRKLLGTKDVVKQNG
jgi:hypothetical protein